VTTVPVPAAAPLTPVEPEVTAPVAPPSSPRSTQSIPKPENAGPGGVFLLPELGLKLEAPGGWLKEQGFAGSVSLVRGAQRYTVQPTTVTNPQQEMEKTVQNLRQFGFQVLRQELISPTEGFQLEVVKAPLSQFVQLKKVGNQWLMITASMSNIEFSRVREEVIQMTESLQAQ
jgi:hypothetical protein